jgi:hypothetical protein
MATTFAVPDGRVAMNAVLRNGFGFGASGGSITSLNFRPDLVWEKARNNTYNHQLIDSVRGASKSLHSNLTSAEDTFPTYFLSFNTNGYTLGAGDYNTGDTLVDWCWKAGGTAVSNTAGTITSSVSANTTAGFSVVTFTGNGVDTLSGVATVGHGLGVVPSFIITKKRSSGTDYNWSTYHISNGNANIWLNLINAKNPGNWVTAPAANVFTPPVSLYGNESGVNYVAYCWAPVAGYSAFGSYTGNGSADGPFIYTGFRPRWVMIKGSSLASNWNIFDSSRATYNANDTVLFADLSNAESSPATSPIDFLSNGIKIRNATGATNSSGNTYIYAVFAENPLKYSNAR